MERISTPPWARKFEIKFASKDAGEAFFAFAPHLAEVLKLLQAKVENFVNDPEQTFLDKESFPARSELSGEYYLSNIYFDSSESAEQRAYFSMWLMVHCLGKQKFEHQTDLDYLGLETYVYIWKDTGELEIDEGFNTSSI